MSHRLQGAKLAFLVSQPRAGSTLLQRILGAHPDIHTLSEPWIMLHPLYAFRRKGFQADYDAELANAALQSFLNSVEGGRAAYLEGVRRMYGHLYEQALKGSGRKLFLDKTPRYYLILEDLAETFPEARFIILLRNPLAVLSSIWEKWVKGKKWPLSAYRRDILDAPQLLLEGVERLGTRAKRIQYEELIRDPDRQVSSLCSFLAVDFRVDMVEYGAQEAPPWKLGDQEVVHRENRPETRYIDQWTTALKDAQLWRLMQDYLSHLGADRIARLGCSEKELRGILDKNRPSGRDLERTLSLEHLTATGGK